MSSNGFVTFLDKIGAGAKKAFSFLVSKALPVAIEEAKKSEPFIDMFAPAFGPEFALVVNSIAATEAGWAMVNQEKGTGPQKLAEVLADVKDDLLPGLTQAGFSSAQAEAKVGEYVQAMVTIMNTFPVATAPAAKAAATKS